LIAELLWPPCPPTRIEGRKGSGARRCTPPHSRDVRNDPTIALPPAAAGRCRSPGRS
jgi:hypothetical protein